MINSGVKQDIFTLEEGRVVVQWPEKLSAESFQDFEDLLSLIVRKAKRSVETPWNFEIISNLGSIHLASKDSD